MHTVSNQIDELAAIEDKSNSLQDEKLKLMKFDYDVVKNSFIIILLATFIGNFLWRISLT